MIKKFKNIYPEEEIIDGFSVLCFDTKKKLEKFSSSLNKNVQRLILNEINKPKTTPPHDSNISQSINISDFKHKVNLNPISPTRITTHRKSKPDMNALTLAICCNKRRTQTSPVKSVDRKIYCVEEYQKNADKENEDITINKVLEVVATNCKEKIQVIDKESELILTDYYASSNKEDSLFAENSLYATSTLSPISLQPVNGLQADVESMDLDSPHKVDTYNLDSPNKVDLEPIDSPKTVDADHLNSHNKVDIAPLDSHNKVDIELLDSHNKDGIEALVSPKTVGIEHLISHNKINTEPLVSLNKVEIESLSSFNKVYIETLNSLTEIDIKPLCGPVKVDIEPVESPIKVDEEHLEINNQSDIKESANCEIIKEVISLQEKVIESSTISDFNNNDQCLDVVDNSKEISEEIDDDCIITSIEFDPDPKLSCITLSSVEHLLSEIPQLKPAPQFISPPSIKTILLQNFQKSPPPPPLIPAPAYYFFSNIRVCKSNPSQNNKSKCISHKSVISPKLKSPKKCIMKSSILKSSSNCVKLSSVKVCKHDSNKTSIQSDKLKNPVVRSILQGTNNQNPKLFSINTVRNQVLTTITPCRPILNKPIASNVANLNNKKFSKIIPNLQIHGTIDNNNRVQAPIMKRNFVKQPNIRKTQNQVDIAHWISQNLCGNTNFERPVSINFLIPKPQVLKPLYRSFVPTVHSNQNIVPSDAPSHISTFNFHNKTYGPERFPNGFITINQLKHHQNEPQIFIRPLNNPLNSLFSATNHNTNSILLNSTISNVATTFCARPNLLPLP